MNFLNLLTKEKLVAGIEISDSVVRIAYFHPRKKNREISIAKNPKDPSQERLILIEEPIAANIIADGVVVDGELLGKTLKASGQKQTWTLTMRSCPFLMIKSTRAFFHFQKRSRGHGSMKRCSSL